MTSVKHKTARFLRNVHDKYKTWCADNAFTDAEHIRLNFWLYYQLRYIKKLDVQLDFGVVKLINAEDDLTEGDITLASPERVSDETVIPEVGSPEARNDLETVFGEIDELVDDAKEVFADVKEIAAKRPWYKFWKSSNVLTENDIASYHLSSDTILISRAWLLVSGELVDIFTRISDGSFYCPQIDLEDDNGAAGAQTCALTPSIYESNRGVKKLLKSKHHLGKTSKKKTLEDSLFVWSLDNYGFQQLTRMLLSHVDAFGDDIYGGAHT